MTQELQELYNLVKTMLYVESPVLSGNMKQGIKTTKVDENEITIEIEAKFYDMKKWRKDRVINHTGKTINGRTDYAEWVNRLGAFGTHNKSEHWVNRALDKVCGTYANEIGADFKNELGL